MCVKCNYDATNVFSHDLVYLDEDSKREWEYTSWLRLPNGDQGHGFNPLHSTMASSETKENIYGAKEMCYRWALNPQGLVLVDLY